MSGCAKKFNRLLFGDRTLALGDDSLAGHQKWPAGSKLYLLFLLGNSVENCWMK